MFCVFLCLKVKKLNRSSPLSFTGMKDRELSEESHGHVCPLAVHPVCLCSAHRRSGTEERDAPKIN